MQLYAGVRSKSKILKFAHISPFLLCFSFGFVLLEHRTDLSSRESPHGPDLFITLWVVGRRGLFLAYFSSEMKARVVVLMWVVLVLVSKGACIVFAMLSLVFGSVLLIVGADRLVTGASALAKRLGLSQLVIGLTVVALGTSTPELFVSAAGALQGKTDLAVGNVVGSNIGNILLILGITGVVAPLAVNARILSFDTPVMITAAVMVAVLGLDGSISRFDGVILLICAVVYLWVSVRSAKVGDTDTPKDTPYESVPTLLPSVVWLVVGLCLLGGGSQLVVSGAVELARAAGLSELVIGLTIVAVGTSLPEIVTSLLAARRGETDLSVGNVVGSNILNVLVILGASSMLTSEGLRVAEVALGFDIPIMIGVSILAWPMFWTHRTVTRLDAVILGIGYALYVTALVMSWENQLMVRAWYTALTAYAICCAGVITVELTTGRPKVAGQAE